jgi:hypothetical protein
MPKRTSFASGHEFAEACIEYFLCLNPCLWADLKRFPSEEDLSRDWELLCPKQGELTRLMEESWKIMFGEDGTNPYPGTARIQTFASRGDPPEVGTLFLRNRLEEPASQDNG